MPTLQHTTNLLLIWVLTLFYGACVVAHMVSVWALRRVKRKSRLDVEDVHVIPPSCLGDPSFGIHRFHKVQDVKLHYVEKGDRTQDLVVLVHGHPDFWFCWRKQILFLSSYFWVVTVDLRGCGDSETPSRRRHYRKEIIVKDLASLIVGLGREETFLVCDEGSCDVGWMMASTYPKMVSKLVLINGPHPYVVQQLFHRSKKNYLKYWYFLFLQLPFLPELYLEGYTKRLLECTLGPLIKHNAITQEEIKAYLYNFSRKDWRGLLHHIRQINLSLVNAYEDMIPTTSPTLILMGDNHPYLNSEDAYRSAEYAERIKIRVIPGGGRSLAATHSKEVNQELITFLPSQLQLQDAKSGSSLVGRVFGAVSSTYARASSASKMDEKRRRTN